WSCALKSGMRQLAGTRKRPSSRATPGRCGSFAASWPPPKRTCVARSGRPTNRMSSRQSFPFPIFGGHSNDRAEQGLPAWEEGGRGMIRVLPHRIVRTPEAVQAKLLLRTLDQKQGMALFVPMEQARLLLAEMHGLATDHCTQHHLTAALVQALDAKLLA